MGDLKSEGIVPVQFLNIDRTVFGRNLAPNSNSGFCNHELTVCAEELLRFHSIKKTGGIERALPRKHVSTIVVWHNSGTHL